MRSSLVGVLVVVGSAMLVGCGGPQGGGSESTGEASLALIDGDARAAGFTLSTEQGRRTAVAPVEVEGKVSLVGPGQKIPLDLAPGELLLVRGSKGELVPFAIGSEIDAARVRVEGTELAAQALARMLGATLSGDGPFELSARDLYAHLSHTTAPEGIRSITPIEIQGEALADDQIAARDDRLHKTSILAQEAAGHPADFTSEDPRFARFGLTGQNAPSCADPAAGTWISAPTYYPAYNDWYTVTLHVSRGEGNALRGDIDVKTWSGGAETVTPPSCGQSSLDVEVNQSAVGELDGSSLRLSAKSWTLGEGSCTGMPNGYNIDKYTGTIDGSVIRSVNNDGGRAVDDPVGFERVSCH